LRRADFAPRLVVRRAVGPSNRKPMSKYVVVWLDYSHALFFHVHPERFDESTIWVKAHEVLRQADEPHEASALEQQRQFFANVASVLGSAEEALVVGPTGAAKLELLQYAYAHEASLGQRIIGIETVEQPTSSQLVEYARRYFVPASKMR
jgi:hypothetical protein